MGTYLERFFVVTAAGKLNLLNGIAAIAVFDQFGPKSDFDSSIWCRRRSHRQLFKLGCDGIVSSGGGLPDRMQQSHLDGFGG